MAGKNKKRTKVIEAAGGLLWRREDGRKTIAVLHRPQYNDWTLPKGKREKGEGWSETALREVKEETNCQVALEGFAGCTCYTVDKSPKVVLYWHMRLVSQQPFESDDETDRIAWLSIEEALEILDYQGERNLLRKSRLR